MLITAGATREPLDPVRHLTNASSGKMGFALAREARRLGARVTVVRGPGPACCRGTASLDSAHRLDCPLAVPPGVREVRVETAVEMHREVVARFARSDAVFGAAAVGDWRFERRSPLKVRKTGRALTVRLIPNPDILLDLSRRRKGTVPILPPRSRSAGKSGQSQDGKVLVGFALETDRWISRARRKLAAKGLDMIVANGPESLGSGRARIAILRPGARPRVYPRMSKERAAQAILREAAR